VIGQGLTVAQTWPATDDSTAGGVARLFGGFLTLKGSACFYMPSIGGLKNL
jgi:hypothetical protein